MSNQEPDGITDLAPSAKLVYKVLDYNGELTQKQIIEKSRLAPRTVRHALGELESADLVEHEIYFADARQQLYRIKTPRSADST